MESQWTVRLVSPEPSSKQHQENDNTKEWWDKWWSSPSCKTGQVNSAGTTLFDVPPLVGVTPFSHLFLVLLVCDGGVDPHRFCWVFWLFDIIFYYVRSYTKCKISALVWRRSFMVETHHVDKSSCFPILVCHHGLWTIVNMNVFPAHFIFVMGVMLWNWLTGLPVILVVQ